MTPAMEPRFTPDLISERHESEIFVFGSNLAGHHGGGAAYAAFKRFGAEWGVGVGLTGHCYAIPTMQGGVDTIRPYVDEFIAFAVTPIGCGIAGFTPRQIAPLFAEAMELPNVVLPREFVLILSRLTDKQYLTR